jgi:hypothetical protein
MADEGFGGGVVLVAVSTSRVWVRIGARGRVGRVALVVCCLLSLAAPVGARASSPSRTQRKAYSVLLNFSKGILAVSSNTVTANANGVGNELAACLSPLLAPAVPQSATASLAVELTVQYVTTATRPLMQLEINADEQTAKLPIRKHVKSELQTWATQTTNVLAINTCADIAAWQSAGFAPASEPIGTQLANNYLNVPEPSTGAILYSMLTRRQQRAIGPIRAKASTHVANLATLVQNLFTNWIAQNGG